MFPPLVLFDGELYGTEGLKESNIIIGQSSTQLTFSLILALLDPGDRVLLFDPTYANFPAQLCLCQEGINILTLPVIDEAAWSFFQDETAILSRLEQILRQRKPRLLIFSSPDNPTGQLVPDGVFFEILDLAAQTDCFVAVDYAYRAQYYTEQQPEHFSASPEEYENLIRIHSNSKWCRGLGRRLGWVEARPDIIDALEVVQQSVILCPDTVHQVALANYLERTLEDGSLKKYLERARKSYRKAAEFLARCIEEYLEMEYLEPEGGLYTVVNVGVDGDQFAYDVLKNTGVVFVPGGGFGPSLSKAIRVSFGPLVNNLARMEEGLARVKDYLARADSS